MSKKKKKIFLFSFIFRVILCIGSVALVLSYLSIFINPSAIWFPSFFGLYFIPIVFLNLFLLFIAIIRRSRSGWITTIALLPSILFLKYFVAIGNNSDENVPTEGDSFKIVSYNVGRFNAGKNNMSKQECQKNIFSFLQKENPDVVCFQEFQTKDTSLIAKQFQAYKYHYFHFFKLRDSSFFGNITLSKYPIISKGKVSFKGSTNLSILTDIKLYDKQIRIYNNHLESYSISPSEEIIQVHNRMRGTNSRRAHQVDVILNNIKESDFLSVVCGDFNDTPMSFAYHKLSNERKDTFLESGKGFGSTFSLFWPLLRIDYILIPESFESLDHTTYRLPFSDHYPISSKIIL